MSKKTRKQSKPIYFCFGDFRSGEKQYRIFNVRNIEDAYTVADALGYEIILDNCLKENRIADSNERIIDAILETIHTKLKGIENVVSCSRKEYGEAQRMKQHFLDSDMGLYFPKILPAPVETEFSIGDMTLKVVRRTYPWVVEYYVRRYMKSPPRGIVARMLSTDDEAMQKAAIRKKRKK